MRRRLTTLMCADLVGYSALMGEDEALAVASVQELRRTHLEPVAANHGGEVLKRMGDGWILSFPSVEEALDCAEEVQNSLAEHDVIKLRIGCHVGEIVEDDTDFYGNGVNIAQRIETEAPPGGALFSEDLFNRLSETRQQELRDVGVFQLKNIAKPMRLYQWRPANLTTAPNAGALPTIGFQRFVAAPDTPENAAVAQDLHDGLVRHSMRRTGVETIETDQLDTTDTVFLVRGRLRASGARARVSLSLILSEDMSTLWTGTYEGDLSDPFAFVDEVLPQMESDVRLQSIKHDGNRLAHLDNTQLSVSELRARAAAKYFMQTIEAWREGIDALDRAVLLSPNDAMSKAMHAQTRLNMWSVEFAEPSQEELDKVGHDLNVAIGDAPTSDFVFWARAAYRLHVQRDFAGMRADIKRSLELNPGFEIATSELLAQAALLEGRAGDAVEALAAYRQKGSTDPFRVIRLAFTSRVYLATGQYGKAHTAALMAADLRPTDRGAQLLKALACQKAGDTAGLEDARAAANLLPKGPSILIEKLSLPDDLAWINDATHPQADPV